MRNESSENNISNSSKTTFLDAFGNRLSSSDLNSHGEFLNVLYFFHSHHNLKGEGCEHAKYFNPATIFASVSRQEFLACLSCLVSTCSLLL